VTTSATADSSISDARHYSGAVALAAPNYQGDQTQEQQAQVQAQQHDESATEAEQASEGQQQDEATADSGQASDGQQQDQTTAETAQATDDEQGGPAADALVATVGEREIRGSDVMTVIGMLPEPLQAQQPTCWCRSRLTSW
jgi:hypothetical protein